MTSILSHALILAAAGALPAGGSATGLAAGTVASQAQPTSTINVPRPASSDPNRQVCRTTRITGSRFPRQICRSAADQRADQENQQDAVREFQHFGESTPGDQNAGAGGPP